MVVVQRDTLRIVLVDTAMQHEVVRLQLQTLDKDAQIADLREKLEEANRKAETAPPKPQSVASRAEAATAMAEAMLAYGAIQGQGKRARPSAARAKRLLDMSTTEFDRQNYGAAVYFAAQVKGLARGAPPQGSSNGQSARPIETLFTPPVPLQMVARGNLREGPGTSFAVVRILDKGTPLMGQSYASEWVRVNDGQGRSGWVFHALVESHR